MKDATTRKLFAELREIKERLDALDTNGRLAEIEKMVRTAVANSGVVVSTVESHGSVLAQVAKTLERLHLRCPRLRPPTDEIEKVGNGGDSEDC